MYILAEIDLHFRKALELGIHQPFLEFASKISNTNPRDASKRG